MMYAETARAADATMMKQRRQGGHRHGGGARGRRAWPARPAPRRSTSQRSINEPWFIGFTQRLRRRGRARARPGRHGRHVAAPIAKQVLRGARADERATASRATRSSTGATACSTGIGSGGMADVYCAEDTPARPPGRAEAAVPPLRRGPGVRRALPPRGVERGRPAAPERRRRLRPRRVGRHLLHRDGVPGGAHAQGARARATARSTPDARDRPRRCRSCAAARLRAPARDRAPRHQAAQRDRRRRGPREGHRLRDRPRRRLGHDRDRLDHGHRAVPLARAGPGPPGRRALRPLLDRRRALRAADRAACRSTASRRWRSRSSRSPRSRCRRRSCNPAVSAGARGRRDAGAARRTRRGASPTPTSSSPRSRRPAACRRDRRVHADRAAHRHVSRAARAWPSSRRPTAATCAGCGCCCRCSRSPRSRSAPTCCCTPKKVAVPDVVGRQLGDRRADPPERGLRGQRRDRAQSDDVPARPRRRRSGPQPGEEADEGSTVTIIVSSGPGRGDDPVRARLAAGRGRRSS